MDTRRVTLMRAIAVLAGIGFVASALAAGKANTVTAPRTSEIAWADCNYGLESLPTPPLAAYLLTPDGIVTRTRSSSVVFEDVQAESAVIGPERFRTIAAGIDRSTLFDPPPKPTPGPDGLTRIGSRSPTPGTRGSPCGAVTCGRTGSLSRVHEVGSGSRRRGVRCGV